MFTIKNKFIIAATVACFSLFGMLAISQYTTHKIKVFDTVSFEVSQVESGMLMQRRNEKDFIARNDLKYKEKFEKNFVILEKRVNYLKDTLISADLDSTQISELKNTIVNYKNSFFELVIIQQKIGMHSKDGLYGALRNAVHQVETEIKKLDDQQLRADMLQLRRNEKDFMLRLDMKYLAKFNKNIDLFIQYLSQSEHPVASKDKIQDLMKQYENNFLELVENAQLKGLNSEQGVLGNMRSTVHETEALIKKISHTMNTTIEEEVGSIEKFVFITNAIGFVLAMIVLATLYWLAVGILQPIRHLAHAMTQAANENNLTIRITIDIQDEIGETSQAFNRMLEKFKQA